MVNTKTLKVLHVIGSPDDPLYFDLSFFFASSCQKPENYEFYYAVVNTGGLWSFPTELIYEKRLDDISEKVTLDKAISKILEIKPDAVVHHMLCTRGFTEYRGLMEVLGFPIVGSSTQCAYKAQNKAFTRCVCNEHGVRMAEGFIVKQGDDITTLLDKISFPCVVKAAVTEDSLGLTLLKERNGLDEALKKAYEYGDVAIIERFIPGREIRASVIRDFSGCLVLLPPYQFHDAGPNEVRTFQHKYNVSDKGRFVGKVATPVFIDTEKESALIHRLEEISFKAFKAFGLEDFVAIDFRVDEEGLPWLLEINMVCSFGPQSVVPFMAMQAGIPPESLFKQMVNSAIKRHEMKSV